jgi:hypothetical protein
MQRIIFASAQPPSTPTTAPTAICRRNSAEPVPIAAQPVVPLAARMAVIKAMPTGSLAPDSPSRIVDVRPATSRRPRTANTTAGSVGARAVPISSEACHASPNSAWASTATAAAVANVPATPIHRIDPAAVRSRCQPMCMPPSNRIAMRATVTMRCTVSGRR